MPLPVSSPKSQTTRLKNGVAKMYEKIIRKRMRDMTPMVRTCCSKRFSPDERCHGSAERSAVNPSSGGNGIRLKRPKKRFMKAIAAAREIDAGSSPSELLKRRMSPKIIASKMFVPHPARATKVSPHRWCFRLYGLYGTGFAQPNMIGECVKTSSAGKTIEPIRSM